MTDDQRIEDWIQQSDDKFLRGLLPEGSFIVRAGQGVSWDGVVFDLDERCSVCAAPPGYHKADCAQRHIQ